MSHQLGNMLATADNGTAFAGQHSRVTFRVNCTTAPGQTVGITGDSSGFGTSRDVITLVTTPEDYPIWSTPTPIVVPTSQSLCYRYCLVEGGTFRSFEQLEKCRAICPKESDLVVEESASMPQSVHTDFSETDLSAAFEKLDSKVLSPNIDVASTFKRLFIISNQLPVVIKRTETDALFDVAWAESMLAKTENSMADTLETYWVGGMTCVDPDTNVPYTTLEKEKLTVVLRTLNCLPIFLEKSVAQGHYNGFCKQVMWPLFHNVDQLDSIHSDWKIAKTTKSGSRTVGEKQKPRILGGGSVTGSPQSGSSSPITAAAATSAAFTASVGISSGTTVSASAAATTRTNSISSATPACEDIKWISEYFDVYSEVNQIFADTVANLMRADDILWVHDYHLMLVPKMLRQSKEFNDIVQKSEMANHLSSGGGGMSVGNGGGCVNKSSTKLRGGDPPHIIFFLHIPFPTSQIFRTLSHADELLTSLTCADVIGFHAFDYTRHFLNATSRILGYTSRSRPGGLLSLLVGDREVIVTMNHLAIEPVMLKQALLNPQTRLIAEHYAAKYAGRKVVMGVDPCQRLSGLAVKFDAFERFLAEDPRAGKNVVLIQKAIRNGSRREDEAHTSAELQQMVTSINNRQYKRTAQSSLCLPPSGANSSRPSTNSPTTNVNVKHSTGSPAHVAIDYEEVSGLGLVHRVALWLVADVFLSTALREGLNLTPMEYIYCRRHMPHAGCVITSDFALTSSLLSGALKANPYDVHSVVDALQVAVFMKDKDANSRRARDLKFITSRNSSSWVRRILSDLRQLTNGEDIGHKMQPIPQQGGSEAGGEEIMQLRCNPRLVANDVIANCYANAKTNTSTSGTTIDAAPVRGSRVFVLDYGGTLLRKEKFDIYVKQTLSDLSASQPSASIMQSLHTLSQDPSNIVMICSGLGEEVLSTIFADLPNVVLFARHGMIISWGESLKGLMSAYDAEDGIKIAQIKTCGGPGGREWMVRDFGLDWTAIEQIAVPILKRFEEQVNGTMASVSAPHLGWNYFSADPDWGHKQASQLVIELEAGLARHDVKVVSHVKGAIHILPQSLNKATMPQLVLQRIMRGDSADVDADADGDGDAESHSRTSSVDESSSSFSSPWKTSPSARGFSGHFPAFALVVGDDGSDDVVFAAMYEALAVAPTLGAGAGAGAAPRSPLAANMRATPSVFTVSVGEYSCSKAEGFVREISDVAFLLEAIAART